MTRCRCLAGVLPLTVLLLLSGCRSLRRDGERPLFRKVSPPVAFEILRDSPWILVVDLRSSDAFNSDTGHLSQAYNIPVDRLPFRLGEISTWRDETFLVYCDTARCAEEGMSILVTSGFENAILMDGGIDAWIARGFKTALPQTVVGQPEIADDSTSPGEGPTSGVNAETTAPPPPR